MRTTEYYKPEELPEPEVLTMRQMLDEMEEVHVLAPLVRCSKLPFRHLVSMYETHVTHTPMMLAPEFSRAQTARISDFASSHSERGVFWMKPRKTGGRQEEYDELGRSNADSGLEANTFASSSASSSRTTTVDRFPAVKSSRRSPSSLNPPSPDHRLVRGNLIAQFASNNGKSLADACEIISVLPETTTDEDEDNAKTGGFVGEEQAPVDEPVRSERLVDGVDLNCGCPQPWAYSEGIGSALLRKPDLVADMVKQVHARMGDDFAISVKIRVDDKPELTERLVQTAIHANVTHLTIHGRTRHQPSTAPVSLPGIRFAVECAKGEVPCVGNGDIWEYGDVDDMRRVTGVKGVMAARGLLANPALFAGYSSTPKHAVENFVELATSYGLAYNLFQRHVSYMLESTMSKHDRLYLNSLGSYSGITDWLEDRGLQFSGRC
ncbi:hypothetical protein FFLO_05928 [Filobasidium floriforme]|uniref:DUS-like FMN-binding domain-containing protein n=1 Tax=Filobasidium floriforme TaxID=5210 RepID=A0A8K0JHP8_9TREE|nr:uncharacterized protein HD553DRAFT_310167 [Filobasidium floriforme]KAG7528787.1 hypothetical protein FFLO_05928 [Filobasidium floriforme]KAH8085757.1 hypothetical protein HD553DRAFT_310167 [Filobasidium floriforme]